METYVHEYVAPRVGRDPLEIEALTRNLTGYLGWRGSGVETRAASAFDIALWDLYGKVCGQPLYQVLGGAPRRVRTYNTCAGYRYIRAASGQSTRNWGLDGKAEGPFEDLDAFLHRADELAQSLLESGITGMKICPSIPTPKRARVSTSRRPIWSERSSRSARFAQWSATGWTSWSSFIPLWRLLPAQRIAQALAEFDTFWHEDLIRMDSLARFSSNTLLEGADRSRLGDPRREMEFQGSARGPA